MRAPQRRAREETRATDARGDCATIGLHGTTVNENHRPRRRALVACATIIMLTSAVRLAAAQPRGPVTEARVRAMAREAARESRGDATELVLALDRRVRGEWGDFESFPLSIVRSDELLVTLTSPYMAFRRSIVDMLRTARTVDRAVWTDAAVVTVTPLRLGAPDIDSVSLLRDGRGVAPVSSALRPMTFSSGTGAESVLHAGDVHFAPSALLPGGTVVLTLMPRGRDPIVYTFTDSELSALR